MWRYSDVSEYVWQCFCLVFMLLLIIWCCHHVLTASSPFIQHHTVSMATASHSGPLTSALVLVRFVWSPCKLSDTRNFSSYHFCLYYTRLVDYLKALVMSWSCALFIWIERLFCSARIALVRLILVSAEAKSYSEATLKNPMQYSSKSGGHVNQCLKKGSHGLDGAVEKYFQKEENVERRKVAMSRERGMEPIQTVGI